MLFSAATALRLACAAAGLLPLASAARAQAADVYGLIPPIDDRGRDQLAMFRVWNADPIGNHARHLASVRPELAAVVRRALADRPDIAFVVGSGLRTPGQQKQAEAWGWSPFVGSRGAPPSLRKHLAGEAVDLWPLDPAGRVTFAPAAMARVAFSVRTAATSLGVRLSWGGSWRRRADPTHFELR